MIATTSRMPDATSAGRTGGANRAANETFGDYSHFYGVTRLRASAGGFWNLRTREGRQCAGRCCFTTRLVLFLMARGREIL